MLSKLGVNLFPYVDELEPITSSMVFEPSSNPDGTFFMQNFHHLSRLLHLLHLLLSVTILTPLLLTPLWIGPILPCESQTVDNEMLGWEVRVFAAFDILRGGFDGVLLNFEYHSLDSLLAVEFKVNFLSSRLQLFRLWVLIALRSVKWWLCTHFSDSA
jgi:hypothetical protein